MKYVNTKKNEVNKNPLNIEEENMKRLVRVFCTIFFLVLVMMLPQAGAVSKQDGNPQILIV